MRKLILIIAAVLLTATLCRSQKTYAEIYNLPGLIRITVWDSLNREKGFFQFDSLSGVFIRRGSQSICFRKYIEFLHTDGDLLTASLKVLRWIRPDGTISNIVEFLQDLGNFLIVKQKWGVIL